MKDATKYVAAIKKADEHRHSMNGVKMSGRSLRLRRAIARKRTAEIKLRQLSIQHEIVQGVEE